MPIIYSPVGDSTRGIAAERRDVVTAYTEWQSHLDAGRLTPRPATSPEIRARHEHNHRILGLRCPGK
jgi:hypothetical protein